jgi:hypothetical protein
MPDDLVGARLVVRGFDSAITFAARGREKGMGMGSTNENYRNFGDSFSNVSPPEDFEGLWIEHWPDGTLKSRGAYQSGNKRIGQHISFWPNGELQEVSYWDEGWISGTLIVFREDGSKERERDYGEYGGRTRCWIERCYGASGDLWTVEVWKDDKMVAEWISPETREVFDEIDLEKIVDQAVKRVYPDG